MIRSPVAGDQVAAYASVIDNRSGDALYLAARNPYQSSRAKAAPVYDWFTSE